MSGDPPSGPGPHVPAIAKGYTGPGVTYDFREGNRTDKVPLPAMTTPSNPTASNNPTKSFLATPGVPLPTRLFTMSRSKQIYGTIGSTPSLISHSKRTAVRGDTISAFLPAYRHLGQEYSAINSLNLASDKRQAVKDLLRNHNKIFNADLLLELDNIKKGLTQMLYQALLSQYSIGEVGITDNLVSLDDASLLSRLNGLGLGTHLRAQMLHVLENSEFFENILPLEIKDKDFKLEYEDPGSNVKTTLINGHVDNAKHVVSFKLDPNTPPELRDLAIKHLVMMVATHTQQNSSNEFKITFGDNPYESLRILQLAIGSYNLHVPKNLITAYMKTLDANTVRELGTEFQFWADNSEVFLERLASNGSKIVNEANRPDNSKGGKMSMAQIQNLLLSHVSEKVFPAPAAPPPQPSAPTPRT